MALVRSTVVVSSVIVGLLSAVSCGGATPEPNDVPVTGAPKVTPRGSVSREAVVDAVDAGFGAFLQRIQVEPVTREGAYLGFQLKAIDPAGGWSAYDVRVGDIVTHANGKSLEAEATVFEVFQSLRTANEIKLSLIREGVSRQVTIPIVGEAPVSQATTSAPTSEVAPSAASSG
jgi:S1-C subfamily serine protease